MTIIKDYFGKGGHLHQIRPEGYAERAEQMAMAEQIRSCMEKAWELRGDRCAILPVQGDTGIGKSLAALIPMLHRVAMHRKAKEGARCGYATFTTQLRRQLAENDLAVAIRAVAMETGVTLTVAEYWGAGQYLSHGALQAALDELPDGPGEERERIAKVLKWLDKEDSDGLAVSAKMDLGIPEHEPLVNDRMDSSWACTWREAKILPAYLKMRENVRNADVLLLSHAAALVNAHRWFSLLSEKKDPLQGANPGGEDGSESGEAPDDAVRYMVFDEAHRLPDAAASLTNRAVSMRRLVTVLEVAHEQGVGSIGADLVKQARACRDALREAGGDGAANQQNDEVVLASQSAPNAGGATVRDVMGKAGISNLYLDILKSVKGIRVKSLGEAARAALLDVHDICDTLDDYLSVIDADKGGKGNPYQLVTGLSWSPVHRHPSLSMSSISPGRMTARYWRHYPGSAAPAEAKDSQLWGAVILSATLPDLSEIGIFNPKEDEKVKLAWQKSPHLMIPNVRSYSCFEPMERFGKMDFVLSAATAPATMGERQQENGRWTSPEWETLHLLPMIDTMMSEAAESDGVLILTPSSLDVDLIAAYGENRPWGHRIIAQRKGDGLAACAAQFRSRPGAVLISAGGWEGLDLPGQIRHLMIARLPKSPVNQTWKEILREKYDEEKVQAIMNRRMHHHMLAKIRQGIGRGIRSVDDRVTVWVADSRFGLPAAITMLHDPRVMKPGDRSGMTSGILDAIPVRFRANLNRARIFSAPHGVFTAMAPKNLGKTRSLGDGMLKFLKDKKDKGEDYGKRA